MRRSVGALRFELRISVSVIQAEGMYSQNMRFDRKQVSTTS